MKTFRLALVLFFTLLLPQFCIAAGNERVDINTAPLNELLLISGITEEQAQAIIKGRPYKSIDELLRIEGVDEQLLKILEVLLDIGSSGEIHTETNEKGEDGRENSRDEKESDREKRQEEREKEAEERREEKEREAEKRREERDKKAEQRMQDLKEKRKGNGEKEESTPDPDTAPTPDVNLEETGPDWV